MIANVVLLVAICGEVFANAMMKSSEGYTKIKPTLLMGVGYCISFSMLSLTLTMMDLGVAYAIWGGLGTAITTFVGVAIYKENLNTKKIVGIGLIILGVVLIKL